MYFRSEFESFETMVGFIRNLFFILDISKIVLDRSTYL